MHEIVCVLFCVCTSSWRYLTEQRIQFDKSRSTF